MPRPRNCILRASVALSLPLVLLLTACVRPLAVPARGTWPHPGDVVPGAAAAVARRAADAVRSRKGSPAAPASALPTIDVSRWMGRPLRRVYWPTRKVAITLDDGPSAETSAVLAACLNAGVRATFFWVGDRAPRYHDLVKLASAEGFEVGNHTWDHTEIAHVATGRLLEELDRAQAELRAETGVEPVFARPPVGHYDAATLKAMNERGLVLALWSVHGQDTGVRGRGEDPATIAQRVVAETRGGDIVLLHERNAHTVEALPAIIAGLRQKGLEPVTLSALLTR